ncbi:glucose-6-phosphate dehydrogenase assembly protein OpcA, partial [Escherichia coli]|uniref:glucose-6-phosphate dehydrogenase assembly protein OpcA n=1 Tax=Escherichia coli TaxID=562 RepID=UPI0032E43F58
LTNWRIQLAAALDEVDPCMVLGAEVQGAPDSPSPLLMAAWLGTALDVPVTTRPGPAGTGLRRVRLTLPEGVIELHRPGQAITELTQPGQPAQRISLPRPGLRDCLAEELRRLDPD